MKLSKSLEEVWKWREKMNEEYKDKTREELVRALNEDAEKIIKKYNLKLKIEKRKISFQ